MEKLNVCESCESYMLCRGRISAYGILISMAVHPVESEEQIGERLVEALDDEKSLNTVQMCYQACVDAQRAINCSYDEVTIRSMVNRIAGID